MLPDSDLENLLARLRAGESSAAVEIVQRYARRLVQLASNRIAGSLRRKVDPEDLVQSAFKSFFRLHREDRFQFNDWQDLWALLATMTIRKFHHRLEYHLAACRNLSREQDTTGLDSLDDLMILARDPSPDEAAELADTVDRLLLSLNDQGRQITELILQGHSVAEIANLVGMTERTVYRQIEKVRTRLGELIPPADTMS